MTRRRGFTLIEVMVAIAVAGIVALLVYGSAALGMETRERMELREVTLRSQWAWHGLLGDALRSIRLEEDQLRPPFTLERRRDPSGRPLDRITFITAGGTPPLTPDADWEVVVEPGAGGIVMTATPVGIVASPRRLAALPGVTGIDVRVKASPRDPGWQEEWGGGATPAAIEITYWRDSQPADRPMLINLPRSGVR